MYQRGILKVYLKIELTENENITYQNMLDTAKALLGVKFTTLNAHIRHDKKTQVNNLNSYHTALEKEDNTKG